MTSSSSSPRTPTTRCSGWAARSPSTRTAGDDVRIVVVTDGSSTQYPGDADIRARKEDEAVRAAAELGVTDYVHLDLPDMRLDTLPHVEVNRVVEEHVSRLRARGRVHAASGRQPRPPRRCSTRSPSRRVRRPARSCGALLTYAPTSSTEWTPAPLNWFVPNWFVDITGTLERKLAAFAHYETERREYPHPRSERAIRAARGVLRRELRLRARGAVRPRSRT